MDEQAKSPHRIVWLTGPKAGQVEPPWPEERPITPAMERLIDALAQKAVEDYIAEIRTAHASAHSARLEQAGPVMPRHTEDLAWQDAADYLAGVRARAAGDSLIRLPEVMRRVGLKKTAIYARMTAGSFPKPTTEGGVSRWFESEIDEYIARLKALRDDRPSP